MITRKEAETFIKSRAIDWIGETGYVKKQGHYASFSDFKRWLSDRREDSCLRFRSDYGAEIEADQWFEAAVESYFRVNRRLE